MRSKYPEVYKTVKNQDGIDYGRVFSEPRSDGVRRIKFWMVIITQGNTVEEKRTIINNLIAKLYEDPDVLYAGYQGRKIKHREVPEAKGARMASTYLEVFVED